MPHLRKSLLLMFAAALLLYAVGCSSNQVAEENTPTTQIVNNQAEQTPPVPETIPDPKPVVTAWTDVDAGKAHQLITSDKTIQIIDLREIYYYRNKHILGALTIPSSALAGTISELDTSKPVLVYDNDGSTSAESAEILTKSGFTKVYNLTGGMATWTYAVEP